MKRAKSTIDANRSGLKKLRTDNTTGVPNVELEAPLHSIHHRNTNAIDEPEAPPVQPQNLAQEDSRRISLGTARKSNASVQLPGLAIQGELHALQSGQALAATEYMKKKRLQP